MKRRTIQADQREQQYFGELREALISYENSESHELIQDIREHIEAALADLPGTEVDKEAMDKLLNDLGTVQEVIEGACLIPTADASQNQTSPISPSSSNQIVESTKTTFNKMAESGGKESCRKTPEQLEAMGHPRHKKSLFSTKAMVGIAVVLFLLIFFFLLNSPLNPQNQPEQVSPAQPLILKPIRPMAYHPKGPVDSQKNRTLWVTFDKALDPERSYKDSLTVFPPVEIMSATVIKNNTLRYELRAPLKRATKYQATLSPNLVGANGEDVQSASWSWTTERPKLLEAHQSGSISLQRIYLTLKFSDPVSPDQLHQYLEIKSPSGKIITYENLMQKADSSQRIMLHNDQKWRKAHLTIKAGLTCTRGPLGIDHDTNLEVDLSGKLVFRGLSSYYRRDTPRVKVRFTHPVEIRKLDDFVNCEPKLDLKFTHHSSGFYAHGDFLPGKRYVMTLKRGLPAGEAGHLDSTIQRSLWFEDKPAKFDFDSPGGYLSPEMPQVIPIVSTNIKKLKLSGKRLLEHNLVEYALDNSYYLPSSLSQSSHNKEISPKVNKNKEVRTLVPLKELFPESSKGIYAVKLDHNEHWRTRQIILAITDIGLSMRKGAKGDYLIWATSLKNAKALPKVKLSLYSQKRTLLVEGETNHKGILHLHKLEGPVGEEPSLLIARQGDDVSFLRLNTSYHKRAFNQGGKNYPSTAYEVYPYCERGVYRSGEEVHLSAWIRKQDYSLPPSFPLVVKVHKPDGKVLKEIPVDGSKQGAYSCSFMVPDNAVTGNYSAAFFLPGEKMYLGKTTFRVEDYLPQTLRLKTHASKTLGVAPKHLTLSCNIRHLFGDPATGLKVKAYGQLRGQALKLKDKKWQGYTFTRHDETYKRIKKSSSQVLTNPMGQAKLKLPTKVNWKVPAVEASIKIEALEEGGRAIEDHLTRTYALWEKYLGLSLGQSAPKSKQSQHIQWALISPDEKLVNHKEDISLKVYEVTREYVLRRKSNNRLQYVWDTHNKCIATHEIANGGNTGTWEWIPDKGGEYLVEISSKNCHGASKNIWVQDHKGKSSNKMIGEHDLKISLDQELYSIGDNVQVQFNAPFSGNALVTIESDQILESHLLTMTHGQATLNLKTQESWRPNVYLTATLIRPTEIEENWLPHRVFGIKLLKLNNSDRMTSIDLSVNDVIRPGDNLEVGLKVHCGGKGLSQATVIISAVDEGILALTDYDTPDPWEKFFQWRRLGVRAYDLFNQLAPSLKKWKLAKSLDPGGGVRGIGEQIMRHLNPVMAKRVKPAVIYRGPVVCNDKGKAKLTIPIPQYIGSLRLMASCAHPKGWGATSKELIIKNEVMVKSSWPRFVAPGDQFVVPHTLFNRSSDPGMMDLSFYIDGPAQISKPLKSLSVNRGEEKLTHSHWQATGPGLIKIQLKASLGGNTFREDMEFSCRPAVKFARESQVKTLSAGSHNIALSGNYLKGTEKGSLYFCAHSLAELYPVLDYLQRYPYGCAEQTTSGLIPLIYLPDLIQQMDPGMAGKEEVSLHMQKGLERLALMQTSSGGLGMYPGYGRPNEYASLYAAMVLIEAQKAGWKIPGQLLDDLLGYIENHVEGWAQAGIAGKKDQLGYATMACYILAQKDRSSYSWMSSLENHIAKLDQKDNSSYPGEVKLYLAATLWQGGENKIAREMLIQDLPPLATRSLGGFLYSPGRQVALSLLLLLDLDRDHPRVLQLARLCEDYLKKGQYTTQEAAFLIMALGKLARRKPVQRPTSASLLKPNGSQEFINLQQGLSLPHAEVGKNYKLTVAGNGHLYAYLSSSGVPTSGEAKENDAGITIRRSFWDRRGEKAVKAVDLLQGELYTVRLDIKAAKPVRHLVISDLLPAGLEIEKSGVGGQHGGLEIEHIEPRDDRLLLFGHMTSKKDYSTYLVRAVTRGIFVLPAADVECMYDPAIYSVHGQKELIISGTKTTKYQPE
ncbi:MAG: hypothetical protein HQL32_09150 [Planctomycetes bacterium]|nr:hypothetical protein [Planctomycetota bacterium]